MCPWSGYPRVVPGRKNSSLLSERGTLQAVHLRVHNAISPRCRSLATERLMTLARKLAPKVMRTVSKQLNHLSEVFVKASKLGFPLNGVGWIGLFAHNS